MGRTKAIDEDLLKKYYLEDHKSHREIAALMKISSSTVGNKLAKLDIRREYSRNPGKRIYYYQPGQKVNMFTIVKETKLRGSLVYECLCHCGRTIFSTPFEMNKRTTGCRYCSYKKVREKVFKRIGYKNIPMYRWSSIKRGAAQRGLVFDITIEQAWDLLIKQEKKCALSGVEIEISDGKPNTRWIGTASLDRIDSSKGYVEGNVQWVHKTINRIKVDLNEEEFINWCKLVVQNKDKS
jgi:DNA-directed RNA polymerase subunit RPC12/RpoP